MERGPLGTCRFPHCATLVTKVPFICADHRCRCLTGNTDRGVVQWGRVHRPGQGETEQRQWIAIEHLGQPDDYSSLDRLDDLCPNLDTFVKCQITKLGRAPHRLHCKRMFPAGYFGPTNICPPCTDANQCRGERKGEHEESLTIPCWNMFDPHDQRRASLHLCGDPRCNVCVPCARQEAGCSGVLYKTLLHLQAPVPDLCEACEKTHHMCQECGYIAVRGDPTCIRFSRYLYPLYAEEHCATCIRCFDEDEEEPERSRVALVLRWWDYREEFARLIANFAVEQKLPWLSARYMMMHWSEMDPDTKALCLRDKTGESIAFLLKYRPRDSAGQLMYMLVTLLPRDVFFIVFRHLLVY